MWYQTAVPDEGHWIPAAEHLCVNLLRSDNHQLQLLNTKPFVSCRQTEPSVCLASSLSLSHIMRRWHWKVNNKLALYNWLNIFAKQSVDIDWVEENVTNGTTTRRYKPKHQLHKRRDFKLMKYEINIRTVNVQFIVNSKHKASQWKGHTRPSLFRDNMIIVDHNTHYEHKTLFHKNADILILKQ
jgi:hypothetical protein